jgi:hypothetical protein
MGKQSRLRERMPAQDMLGKLASHTETKVAQRRDSASEVAESFRRARQALELATRDVVALRHRLTKPPSRRSL